MWRRPDVLVDVLDVTDGVDEFVIVEFVVPESIVPEFIVESLEGVEGDTVVSVLLGVWVVLGSKVESGADVLGVASVGMVSGVTSVESAGVCVEGVDC